jgi:hypothetical protein
MTAELEQAREALIALMLRARSAASHNLHDLCVVLQSQVGREGLCRLRLVVLKV